MYNSALREKFIFCKSVLLILIKFSFGESKNCGEGKIWKKNIKNSQNIMKMIEDQDL